MRDVRAEWRAEEAAKFLRQKLGITEANVPTIGIVLGTGWGNALSWDEVTHVSFEEIPGFDWLRPLAGHDRKLAFGKIGGRSVVALQGRVHLNEAPDDPSLATKVRLQIEMLLRLGVHSLILTAAVGSLTPDIGVGDVTIVDGFVTLFAPVMPLYAGEFVSPEDALDAGLQQIAAAAVAKTIAPAKRGAYVMIRGPFFEGRKYDKAILADVGASVVGMSVLPEACVAALYPGTRVVVVAFTTNTAFETHSHASNQAVAGARAAALGACLKELIAHA